MPKERFTVPKKYGTSEVTFFPGDAENEISIPVNGIEGLSGYGFIALHEAQTLGGPKTPSYVGEVAADLCVYLANGWKPGDSAGIMRRKFQLTRAMVVHINRRNKKGANPVSFAHVLPQVLAKSDPERQALWNSPEVQPIISRWNLKGERKSTVDVGATLKSIV